MFILQMLMSVFRDKGHIESIRFRSVVNKNNMTNVSNIYWSQLEIRPLVGFLLCLFLFH